MSILVGDIGGTHSRFGLVSDGAFRPERIDVEDDDRHETFESAVAAYLDEVGERPEAAVFAIAGPIAGRRVRLTNRDWVIDAAAIEKRFGIGRVELINDFVAQAASLPHLEPHELEMIGGVAPSDHATKAALGPGTGLGVAGLVRDGKRWIPVPSEGGHIEFASLDDREGAALALVRRDIGRVEAEQILSGPGLARLHRALADVSGRTADLDTPVIVAQAIEGDPAATETVRMFLGMLARFAGDVALMYGARGGVYFCGGVTPRLKPLLDSVAFRAAFEAKRPHEGMMREIATLIVTSGVAGLIGCAAVARSTEAIEAG